MQSGYSSTVATLLNKTRGALQQHLRLNVKLKQNPCLRPIKAHWWIETWNSRLICNMLRWVMRLKAPLSALYDVKNIRIPSNLRRSRTFFCWSCKWSSPSAPPLPSSSLHAYSSPSWGSSLRRSAIQSEISCSSSQQTVWPMSSYSRQSTDTSTWTTEPGWIRPPHRGLVAIYNDRMMKNDLIYDMTYYTYKLYIMYYILWYIFVKMIEDGDIMRKINTKWYQHSIFSRNLPPLLVYGSGERKMIVDVCSIEWWFSSFQLGFRTGGFFEW